MSALDESVERFLEARKAQGLPEGVVDVIAVARIADVVETCSRREIARDADQAA